MKNRKEEIKYNIEVKLSNFDVDEEYYTFQYKVFLNEKLKDTGEIQDDYENGMTPEQWEKVLKTHEALNLVMVRVFE